MEEDREWVGREKGGREGRKEGGKGHTQYYGSIYNSVYQFVYSYPSSKLLAYLLQLINWQLRNVAKTLR